jgi:hypothetical protein
MPKNTMPGYWQHEGFGVHYCHPTPLLIITTQTLSATESLSIIVISVAFAALPLATASIKDINRDSRAQLVGISQKFVLVTVLFTLFAVLTYMLNQPPFKDLDVAHPNWASINGWVIAIAFLCEASCYFGSIALFIVGTADLVVTFAHLNTKPDENHHMFKADYPKLHQLHTSLLASRVSGTNDEKKNALESYMASLFEMIDKVKCVKRDSLSSVDEIDLIFQNENVGHALLNLMAPNFMVLCRNTADPVNSKEMRAFKDSIILRGLRYGIYVSVNGFTGFKQKGHGAGDCLQAIRDARNQGYRILTLDLSDLEQILDHGQSLVDILWEKNNDSLTY